MTLSPGSHLGPYEIVGLVGEGGMGEVYEGRDTRLGRRVAIKVIRAAATTDPDARARFQREARSVSSLEHPQICPLYDVGHEQGRDFLVMQFLEGETLADRLRRGPLRAGEAIAIGLDVARALEYAHGRGIVHRDLKPANVMLTANGAKLMDFGLAAVQASVADEATRPPTVVTETGLFVGTLQYMAPEVLRGDPADGRSDLWAVGVTLYEAVTGRRPFSGRTTFALTSAIMRDSPAPFPPEVPASLGMIIGRCVEKDPGHRYQLAGELRAALEAQQPAVSWRPAPDRPAGPSVLTRQPPRTGRGIPRPALLGSLLVMLAVGALAWWVLTTRQADTGDPSGIRSIAVLPFTNLSSVAEHEYIADGVTDALITALAQIRSLRVISRQSVERYRGGADPLAKIAGDLQIEAVIQGTVFRVGDRIRVTAQLVRVAPEGQLWAGSYERSFADILILTSEVAQEAANQVRVVLTPQEQAMLARRRPVNPEAHQAYLLGRYFWNKRTKEGVERAISEFRRAITIDPTAPLSYAGLADAYLIASDLGIRPPEVALEEAQTAAATALRLDDLLAEAHASLGLVHSFKHRWIDAEREYRRALELKPGYASAHQWYALNLSTLRRHDEAITEARRALELDPLSPLLHTFLGQRLYLAGRYDEALVQLRRTLDMDPGFNAAHSTLGLVHVQQRAYAEAIREFQIAASGSPYYAMANLGHAYGASGDLAAARRVLQDFLARAPSEYVPPHNIALVYLGLGDRERAIDWLLKSARDPSSVVQLAVDPRLTEVRKDPRVQAMLREAGVP